MLPDDEAQTPETLPVFSHSPRNVIVTEAFLTAAIELAEGMRRLSRTENADDISQIPRMYWERWDGAADVILGRLK